MHGERVGDGGGGGGGGVDVTNAPLIATLKTNFQNSIENQQVIIRKQNASRGQRSLVLISSTGQTQMRFEKIISISGIETTCIFNSNLALVFGF